jgi:hypothetical protein
MTTVSDVTNITLLMMIFVMCYLLIGMELFAAMASLQTLL